MASGKLEDPVALLVQAQGALKMNSTELAELLGFVPKTVYRWTAKRTSMSPAVLGELAPRVWAVDPKLAARMHACAAEAARETGLAPPPPLPQAAPAPAAAGPAPRGAPAVSGARGVADVVLAACEAMDATPRVARAGLLAAVQRASELGVTLDDLARELAPKKGAKG